MPTPPPSPATFTEFSVQFPTEDACAECIAKWRWPSGFVCPACREQRATRLKTRPLWECRACGRQTSVTAGTVLQHTKVPLRVWAYAIWLVARRKKGISALQFQRETGLGSYSTALYLLHKVRQVLAERDPPQLEGVVEMDNAILPGKEMKPGKRLGKGGAFVLAAVERRSIRLRNGRTVAVSGSARAAVSQRCDGDAAVSFTESSVVESSLVITDGGPEYRHLVQAAVNHDSHDQHRVPSVSDRHLRRVHLFFSNFKTWLRGAFHGVSLKHLHRYLNEYVYRFNRRHHGAAIFGFVVSRLVASPWTSKKALAAEGGA